MRILRPFAVLTLTLLVLPLHAAAQTADTKAVVAALTQQADAWDKAIVRKDRAAILANMADDFRSIDGAGTVETKPVFVDGLMDAEADDRSLHGRGLRRAIVR